MREGKVASIWIYRREVKSTLSHNTPNQDVLKLQEEPNAGSL